MKSRFLAIIILTLWHNTVSEVPSFGNQDNEAANQEVENLPRSSAEGTTKQHLDIAKGINVEKASTSHDKKGAVFESVSQQLNSYGVLQEDVLANLSHSYPFPWPYDEDLMPYFTAHTADGLEVELLKPIEEENIDIISETGDHLLKEAEDFYHLMNALIRFVKGLKQKIKNQPANVSSMPTTSEPEQYDDSGSLESYRATNTTICPYEQTPEPVDSEDDMKTVENTNAKWEELKDMKYFQSAMKYLAKAAQPKKSLKESSFDDFNFNRYIPGNYDILYNETNISSTMYTKPDKAKHTKEEDLQKTHIINDHVEDFDDIIPYDINNQAPVTQEESPVAATGESSLPEQDNDSKTNNYILANYFRDLLRQAIFGL